MKRTPRLAACAEKDCGRPRLVWSHVKSGGTTSCRPLSQGTGRDWAVGLRAERGREASCRHVCSLHVKKHHGDHAHKFASQAEWVLEHFDHPHPLPIRPNALGTDRDKLGGRCGTVMGMLRYNCWDCLGQLGTIYASSLYVSSQCC